MNNQLKYYQLTSVGDRAINQDCMAHRVNSEYGLFVVADGLGGHYAGEKAAQFFCQGLFKLAPFYHQLLQDSTQNVKTVMEDWIDAAVDDMRVMFLEDAEAIDAHTTCVVLYVDDNVTVTAHCGDSRLYRLNDKQVLWRTKDHSLIQKKLDEGKITEGEMGLHPEQNQLTQSINIKKNHSAEVNIYPPAEKGETFILCSDGFWEYIKEKDLLQLSSPHSGLDQLKKVAKMAHLRANGKGDNITVQWVRCL
ncbi:MAG: serine/threonine-protein phosphatase [Methylococcales bacterium]|nr:serine/threonine-protein phosphatase [Methylococcales bacterium]